MNYNGLIIIFYSAGAVGVFLNVDRIHFQLKKLGLHRVDVRGIADSGWFLDSEPFAISKCRNAHSCSPKKAVQMGFDLWKGQLTSACSQEYPTQQWECYLGYKIVPTIKSKF